MQVAAVGENEPANQRHVPPEKVVSGKIGQAVPRGSEGGPGATLRVNRTLDVVDRQGEASVAVPREHLTVTRRHELEEHGVDEEARHRVTGGELQAEHIEAEGDRAIKVADVAEDAVESERAHSTLRSAPPACEDSCRRSARHARASTAIGLTPSG
jgi:hypothetical protein